MSTSANMTTFGSIENKTALVTGATGGIGRKIVESLVQNKIKKVYAVDQFQDALIQLHSDYPLIIEPLQVDLRDWKSTEEILNKSINGSIDFLVNCAGVAELQPLGQVTEDVFDLHFDVNVKAIVNVTQVVSSKMIQNQTPGSIVNVSSIASTYALKDHLVYCASKSAVDGLTRVLALELGPHQVRVNSIHPTVVMTELGKKVWSDKSKADTIIPRIPMGRFVEPEEVASAILFLLSDSSSMINGSHLPIDGGMLIA